MLKIYKKASRFARLLIELSLIVIFGSIAIKVIDNFFMEGPPVQLQGAPVGFQNSSNEVYVRWWAVRHTMENDYAVCLATVLEAVEGFSYVDKSGIVEGWVFARQGSDYTVFYCDRATVRLVTASTDKSRGFATNHRIRMDLFDFFKNAGVLGDYRN